MRTPAQQARAIQRGAKTTLRVPIDSRLTATPLRPARRGGGRPFHPQTGDLLAIHGGQAEDGKWITTDLVHVILKAVARTPLGTITPVCALAEGHSTVEEFEIAFVERHDSAWLERQREYLIEQGVAELQADEAHDAWAKVRYDTYWKPRQVWLLTIEPVHDMPMLLAEERGTPKGTSGYVHSSSAALTDEPEAILVDKLHKRWTMRSDKRYQDARSEEQRVRDAKQLGRRLRSAKLRNPQAPEIAVIEAQLAQLEARYSQAA